MIQMDITKQTVKNILGKQPRRMRMTKELEDAIPGKPCFNCGRLFKKGEKWHYWYHGDQDDRLCTACAKKLKHTDTAYAGMPVYRG